MKELTPSIDTDLIAELRKEARKTVDAQIVTINDIDTKASRILRLNILLIGVVVSVSSIAAQNGDQSNPTFFDPGILINPYMGLGFASLVLSTAFAAITYGASELDMGVGTKNVENFLSFEFEREEFESLLLKNYVSRINFNRSTNIRNLPLITATLNLVVFAVVFFFLGIYEVTIGDVPHELQVVAGVFLTVIVWRSGIVVQSYRAIKDIYIWWHPIKRLWNCCHWVATYVGASRFGREAKQLIGHVRKR